MAAWCLLHLDCWTVGYLDWHWSPDHDVFATLARSWDAGVLPYRDMLANNPPPTIYVYWLLGMAFGWGRTTPFFACDAALLAGLGLLAAAWSERLFASMLPALLGYALFLRFYLPLDHTMIGQRDWHASALSVAALMVLQAWPSRRGRFVSGTALGLAVATRPQAALLVPAALLAIVLGPRRGKPVDRKALAWSILEFEIACAGAFALMFVPLLAAGILDDFARCFQRAAYGGMRNALSFAIFWDRVSVLLRRSDVAAPIVGTLALAFCGRPRARRFAWPWLAAAVAAVAYKPISPRQHDYLDIPRFLVLSANTAFVCGAVLNACAGVSWRKLGAALSLAALCGQGERPPEARDWTYATWPELRRGAPPVLYRNGYVGTYSRYEYEEVLKYLKTSLRPRTALANALGYPLALTGPTGRLSAFPAESMAWLRYVRPDDEEAFARKLEATPDSVVVWCPSEFEEQLAEFALLKATIERLYEPEKSFYNIEIWRRKGPRPEGPSR